MGVGRAVDCLSGAPERRKRLAKPADSGRDCLAVASEHTASRCVAGQSDTPLLSTNTGSLGVRPRGDGCRLPELGGRQMRSVDHRRTQFEPARATARCPPRHIHLTYLAGALVRFVPGLLSCAARRNGVNGVSTNGRLSIAGPAGGKAAGFNQSRPIGSRTALALPTDVPAAGTLDGGHDHVPGQQPVAALAAPGRSVRPVRCRHMRQLADVNTHRNTLASACGSIPG